MARASQQSNIILRTVEIERRGRGRRGAVIRGSPRIDHDNDNLSTNKAVISVPPGKWRALVEMDIDGENHVTEFNFEMKDRQIQLYSYSRREDKFLQY